ncbi:MAG: immune inhibitor A, partial [Tetrasphaera sp.]|nr:immune inhibitor A [Tetrasphaera sp.]
MHKHIDDPCFVAPAPELRDKLDAELTRLRKRKTGVADALGTSKEPRALGLNDGLIMPPDSFPFGTPETVMRASALERAPLRGAVRVIVVLADTSDKPMTRSAQSFRDLFFSTGVVPTGSVREYYREVTNGLVDVVGEVVGPYRLPQTMAWYANGNFGIGRPSGTTRARNMAADALALADPHVTFGPYDNDGNGYVDAFIVVHSGRGGEETGNSGDIWSHKWVLPSQVTTDSTKVYGYL